MRYFVAFLLAILTFGCASQSTIPESSGYVVPTQFSATVNDNNAKKYQVPMTVQLIGYQRLSTGELVSVQPGQKELVLPEEEIMLVHGCSEDQDWSALQLKMPESQVEYELFTNKHNARVRLPLQWTKMDLRNVQGVKPINLSGSTKIRLVEDFYTCRVLWGDIGKHRTLKTYDYVKGREYAAKKGISLFEVVKFD
jgi:hypothetical protein